MPDLKLLTIEEGDSQKNLIDKSNFNFSQVIVFDGGPYGRVGLEGVQGLPGTPGPKGSYGDMGFRGSIWTLNKNNPGITGYANGDFWLDVNTGSGNPIYQFSNNSWNLYGFNLLSQDLFRINYPVPTSLGNSSFSGYNLSSINPERYTLALSDNSLVGATATTNPQYSKVVISVDGSSTGRGIMEFSKIPNLSNSAIYTGNPRFIWSATSSTDIYGLSFLSKGSLLIDVPNGEFSLAVSANNGVGFGLKTSSFNMYLSESQGLSLASTSGRVSIDLGAPGVSQGKASIVTRNITYANSIFNILTTFDFRNESTDSAGPLSIISNASYVSGFRHKSNVTPNANSRIFRAYSAIETLLDLNTKGELYYNKRINSIQSPQTPSVTVAGSAWSQGSVTYTAVNWYAVVPTSVLAGSTNDRINSSNGIDYVASITPVTSTAKGVYLWTPATGGSGPNTNDGWLNLLNDHEAITVRIRTASESQFFRFIGLGTGATYNTSPYSVAGTLGYGTVDLTNSNSIGASHVDFTIMNIAGAGSTAGNKMWYMVYYNAYGGNMPDQKCGFLCTTNSTSL